MSDNQDVISRTIYLHDPINPPAVGHGVDAKIKLVNSKHLSIENWQKGEQPSFTLKITDPKTIGLLNFQEHNVERLIDDLILSCNLVLNNAAFSRHRSDSTRSAIERKKKHSPKLKVEDTPSGKAIFATEVMRSTDSFHITIGFEDKLDESEVLELLSKISSLKNGNVHAALKVNNIQKSLSESATKYWEQVKASNERSAGRRIPSRLSSSGTK